MRILIIGAQGTLGQALAHTFAGAEVLAWGRQELDLTDAEAVRAKVRSAVPDCIINAAAYTAVEGAEGEESTAHTVNGTAVGALAAIAADLSATFVHFSTDFVFDGFLGEGYTEDAAAHPINAYGRTKLAGERALAEVAAQYPSWRWYCIRTSRLYGRPGSSANAKRSFVDAILTKAATEERIEVVDMEVASPTYARDLARATRGLVWEGLGGTGGAMRHAPSGVYHRTNDGSCTWYEFAREIFRRTHWRGTLVPVPVRAYSRVALRPARSVLRTTKLPPLRRWEDALAEYLTAHARMRSRDAPSLTAWYTGET